MANKRNRNNYGSILKYFPQIELSYEKYTHNKVQSDIYLLVPKGKKCFLWFKLYKNKPHCFLMYLNLKSKKITSIQSKITSFNPILCSGKGTILFGTTFLIKENLCFNIENMYYFKGHNTCRYNQYEKLKFISEMINNYISQHKIVQKQLTIGTPIISQNITELYEKAKHVPYVIYSIQHRLLFKNKPFLNLLYKSNQIIYKTFLIKATIINDIYDLYALDENEKLQKYKISYIPDYKTSVFMNNHFRTIKENINLDALEESDSEDEFEDMSIDKFVDLDKREIMKCVYNSKFNGWVPIEKSKDNIAKIKEINFIEKKNNY
tara:strand:- start:1343 stop:2305 length:963 start_codon:yes stop_codon:yes gene_type:complete